MNVTARGDVVSRRDAVTGSAAAFAAAGLNSAVAIVAANAAESTKMPKPSAAIRAFAAKRVRYETSRAFDDVLADFRRLVGEATGPKVKSAAGETAPEFEKRMQSLAGDSGFMLFKEINHGEWLPIYGIRRKVVRLIFGNPVIAYTTLRHDIIILRAGG